MSASTRLSLDLIAEFQKRYFDVFGEAISPEFAEAELLSLVELVRITQSNKTMENEDE